MFEIMSFSRKLVDNFGYIYIVENTVQLFFERDISIDYTRIMFNSYF